jgi:ribosome maturation factor RimP
MGAEENIADALRPAVHAAGLEIWDVERSGTSLRVLVERGGGVDLQSISEVSGLISAALDQRDDLVPAGRYTLEVSSPGLERRLRHPWQYARYIGEEVAVKTLEAVNGARRLRGTLIEATDEAVTVRAAVSGPETQDVRLPLTLIDRANTVFTWGPAPRPPKPAKPTKSAKPAKPAKSAKSAKSDKRTGPGKPVPGAASRANAARSGHLAEASEEAR